MFNVYIFIAAAAIFIFIAENLYPSRQQPLSFSHYGKNTFLGFSWFFLVLYLPIQQNFRFISLWQRPGLDWRVATLCGVLILDFATYWWHRFNHTQSFFQKVHWVHHSEEVVNFTTSFRFHFVELSVYYFYKLLICSVLQIPLLVLAFFDFITFISGIFHHSNISIPNSVDRWIRKIIVTPRFHLNHHSVKRSQANSNYSSFLTIWDHLFKTYTAPIIPEKIGVGGNASTTLWGLLTHPFKRGLGKVPNLSASTTALYPAAIAPKKPGKKDQAEQ